MGLIMSHLHKETDLSKFILTISNADRLKIISCISQQNDSISHIAAKLKADPADISKHLEILERANLIAVFSSGSGTRYQLNHKTIELIARQQLSKPNTTSHLDSLDLETDQQRIVTKHTLPDGSLKRIPSKQKEIVAVLEYVCSSFDLNLDYNEKEVNAILSHFHPDTTTLRRYLVDFSFLAGERDGTRYWRLK